MPGKTRKATVFRRLYSPIKHAIMASKESIGAVTNTAKHVACDGLTGLDRIGSSVTTHANMAVNDLLGRRGKSRRATRKSRGRKAGKR
jgi:hypothetical protein